MLVDDVFDFFDFFRRHFLRMAEVKAQPFFSNIRASLDDVIAEHVAQRLVGQMRRRVVLLVLHGLTA